MRRYVAELMGGASVLVFVGVGTAVLTDDKVGCHSVAFAFGLTLLTMACAIGPVSNCHTNSATIVGFLSVLNISPRDAAGYITDSVIEGVAASALLLVVATSLPGGYGASVRGFVSSGAVVGFAGIPIGLTPTLMHLISVSVDNTSVNPARSIGPATFAGTVVRSQLWMLAVVFLIGGIIGALAYRAQFTVVPTDSSVVATESSTGRQRHRRERSRS